MNLICGEILNASRVSGFWIQQYFDILYFSAFHCFVFFFIAFSWTNKIFDWREQTSEIKCMSSRTNTKMCLFKVFIYLLNNNSIEHWLYRFKYFQQFSVVKRIISIMRNRKQLETRYSFGIIKILFDDQYINSYLVSNEHEHPIQYDIIKLAQP